jgi:enoyl-CoA hydratase/carnithine racemase
MLSFERYSGDFQHLALRRSDGIVEVRLHTDGDSLVWGTEPHREIGECFRAMGQDPENRVIILTGTGARFSGPRATETPADDFHVMSPSKWETLHAHGIELMDSVLSVQVPVIAAVNGPALRHCELALMSDIVLCSEGAEFQDSAHFPIGLTPGDGINVVTPLVMGLTRSRYFHLTGQVVDAHTAKDWGLVNEVLPGDQLLDRAWELARTLTRQKKMVLRHTRLLFTAELRRRMLDMVGYGLALEGLDVTDALQASESGHRVAH